METLNHLRALLKHEVEDLISAEDQIISAMPMMIEKASDSTLKKSLQQHLKVTQQQRKRLDKVQKLLSGKITNAEDGKKGLFSRLLGSTHECKGMKGIITEGQKVMKEKMTPAVMDAAIIAAAQKVEHYEICGYGTAKAYARELNLSEVEQLLDQTLSEEYEADEKLTELAIRKINKEAETNKRSADGSYWSRSGGRSSSATSRSEVRGSTPASQSRSSQPKTSTSPAKRASSGKKAQSKTGGTAKKKTTSKSR